MANKWTLGKDLDENLPYYKRKNVMKDAWYCPKCFSEAPLDTDYGQQLYPFCPFCGEKLDGKVKT